MASGCLVFKTKPTQGPLQLQHCQLNVGKKDLCLVCGQIKIPLCLTISDSKQLLSSYPLLTAPFLQFDLESYTLSSTFLKTLKSFVVI